MHVTTKRPKSGWTKKQWSPYAGYAIQLVQWRSDVYGQFLFEMLEGPQKGEYRWFKPEEIVHDEPEDSDGDAR